MITVAGNKLSLCHKGCGGIAIASIPDVCKTPAPMGMVPIPYPNIAKAADLVNGSKKVKADGNSIAIQGSKLSRSTGDEAGTGGGIVSNVTMGEAAFITFSPTITVEGKPACRFTDKLTMNKQNTLCMSGIIIPPVVAIGSGPASEKEEEIIEEELKGIDIQDQEERKVTSAKKLLIVPKTDSEFKAKINLKSLVKLIFSKENIIHLLKGLIYQTLHKMQESQSDYEEDKDMAEEYARESEPVDGLFNGKSYEERRKDGLKNRAIKRRYEEKGRENLKGKNKKMKTEFILKLSLKLYGKDKINVKVTDTENDN